MQIDRHKMIEFKQNGDDRGKLVVVEGMKDIPFDIKRIFYIYGSDTTVIRGQHANRRSEFVLINVCGSSKVRVRDGEKEEVFVLDKPHTGIYLPKMIWKDMYDFSGDSILLVLASEGYDSSEYIRDFDEYIKEVN
ncbi:sugar 3,4-ketoisomerase [Clostridium tagluense]|uniref:sugar 3,4-ketoisomerase n=1 Tax=Clostridium tagluense TaxID=360422 RepID=UPI001C6E8D30|nr:FdtA/QdtA family cupin domain-containing protein [Clostridium tagluense]MBW9157003.1 FdtA/QdtA family cupin domain-containing protein [Clostridium tagluense]WLC64990.1 FdtA/QdtA family cupin domain-containing protein [Clostridium tagluense]